MTIIIDDNADDTVYAILDKVDRLLETRHDVPDWTPSAAARGAGISTDDAHVCLRYLAAHRYIVAAGNGAWTRYSLTDHRRENARRAAVKATR